MTGVNSGRRIAIVGAGIGGLTLAVELRRQGLEPHVYEQAEELREVGAAVALSANATRFLRDRTGIGEGLAEKSADVDGLVFRDGRDGRVIGRVLSREAYRARCGAPYYGIHRADIQQLLAGALGGVGLHLGKRLVRIDDSGAAAAVLHFADGDRAEADLVIGADGAKSLLRREVVGYDDARFSGCYGWRGIVGPEHLDLLPDPEAIQFWMGPGGHLLHYPIGSGEQNFLLVKRLEGPWPEQAWLAPGTPGEHVAAFEGWHPAVLQMVNAAPHGRSLGALPPAASAPVEQGTHHPARGRRACARPPPRPGREPVDRGRDRARRLPDRRAHPWRGLGGRRGCATRRGVWSAPARCR